MYKRWQLALRLGIISEKYLKCVNNADKIFRNPKKLHIISACWIKSRIQLKKHFFFEVSKCSFLLISLLVQKLCIFRNQKKYLKFNSQIQSTYPFHHKYFAKLNLLWHNTWRIDYSVIFWINQINCLNLSRSVFFKRENFQLYKEKLFKANKNLIPKQPKKLWGFMYKCLIKGRKVKTRTLRVNLQILKDL